MTDDRPFADPSVPVATAQPTPGELLWEFRRADHRTFAAEIHFQGESVGWEVTILRDADLLISRLFVLRGEAIGWAKVERVELEKGGD